MTYKLLSILSFFHAFKYVFLVHVFLKHVSSIFLKKNGYTIGALLESAAYHEAFEPQIMVWHSIFAIEHCFRCGSLSRM